MEALQTSRLFRIVAGLALLFALSSSALALAIFPFITETAFFRGVAVAAVIVIPDALATWWLFRRLGQHRTANDARRGATAFAFSVPLVLSVGYMLGVLVGGYAEVFLGRVFILPAIIVFISVLIVTIPGVVVRWALHPSGGVGPINQDLNEHR